MVKTNDQLQNKTTEGEVTPQLLRNEVEENKENGEHLNICENDSSVGGQKSSLTFDEVDEEDDSSLNTTVESIDSLLLSPMKLSS
jgi:hypothetical protein